MSKSSSLVAILANGAFPQGGRARQYFEKADVLVCCDGAAKRALEAGRVPDVVVGDLDSLPQDIKEKLRDKIVQVDEQETNDLSKAFRYCLRQNWRNLVVLGATGKREDHTLGNIALLADFASLVDSISIETDDGRFVALVKPGVMKTQPGAQISIFSFDPNQEITSQGLKYPLRSLKAPRWHTATLNEALGESFSLQFDPTSPLLIYIADEKKSDRQIE